MTEALFQFRCLREHTFSAFAPIGKTPDSRPCPECGHTARTKFRESPTLTETVKVAEPEKP